MKNTIATQTSETGEPTVTTCYGRQVNYSQARILWENGEFSDWAEDGFPITIGSEKFSSWRGVEDALSDDTWDSR